MRPSYGVKIPREKAPFENQRLRAIIRQQKQRAIGL
jgi:hypothetical protein